MPGLRQERRVLISSARDELYRQPTPHQDTDVDQGQVEEYELGATLKLASDDKPSQNGTLPPQHYPSIV